MKAAFGPLKDFTGMLSGEKRLFIVLAVKSVLYTLKTKSLKLCDGDTHLTTG